MMARRTWLPSPAMAANVAWLLVVAGSVVVYGLGVAGVWSDATVRGFGIPETMFADGYSSLRSGELAALQDLGLNETAYAAFLVLRHAFLFGASLVIAFLIWRRSRTWVAAYVTLFLVVGNVMVLGDGAPGGVLGMVFLTVGVVSLLGMLYVFPDGRHARLFALLLGGSVAFIAAGVAITDGEFFWLYSIYPTLLIIAGGVALQLRRIRKEPGSSGPRFALLGTYMVGILALGGADALLPERQGAGLVELVWRLVIEAAALSLPLAMGLVIVWQVTRHGLWDVELAVNRTAVYVALSALVAGVYVGAVIVSQAILRQLTGIDGGNTLGVVFATALVAMLVLPAQRRIQAGIDRVFFRRRYDVARTLSSFTERVRNRENLGEVAGDLLGIVEDTFQPEQATLFLARPQRRTT